MMANLNINVLFMFLISRGRYKKIKSISNVKKGMYLYVLKRHTMTTIVICFLSLGALPRHDC